MKLPRDCPGENMESRRYQHGPSVQQNTVKKQLEKRKLKVLTGEVHRHSVFHVQEAKGSRAQLQELSRRFRGTHIVVFSEGEPRDVPKIPDLKRKTDFHEDRKSKVLKQEPFVQGEPSGPHMASPVSASSETATQRYTQLTNSRARPTYTTGPAPSDR